MRLMTEKGLLVRSERFRSHVYEPAAPQNEMQKRIAGDLLKRVFGGSPKGLIMSALGAQADDFRGAGRDSPDARRTGRKEEENQMSAIQILATQPWVERLGLTLLHFLWQGAIIVAIYAAARKWGARSPGPERPLSSRLCGTCGDGHRPSGDLDAAARTGAGIRRRHLHGAHVRCSKRARSTCSPRSLTGDAYPAMPGPFLSWVVAFWLAGATAFSLRLLGGWIARRTPAVQNGAAGVRRMAADPRSAQKPAFLSPGRSVCWCRGCWRRRPPSDGFGRWCWCRSAP